MKPLRNPKPDDSVQDVIMENRKHIARLERKVKALERKIRRFEKRKRFKEVIPMEQKKESEVMVKVRVDTSELDEAIKKARQLKDLLLEIDSLYLPKTKKLFNHFGTRRVPAPKPEKPR